MINVQLVLRTTERAWKQAHGKCVEAVTLSIYPPYSRFHTVCSHLLYLTKGLGIPIGLIPWPVGSTCKRLLSSDLHLLAFWSCSVPTFLSGCYCDLYLINLYHLLYLPGFLYSCKFGLQWHMFPKVYPICLWHGDAWSLQGAPSGRAPSYVKASMQATKMGRKQYISCLF